MADMAIDGNDLIELGVQRGPYVGYLLKRLLREVIDGDVANNRDALVARVNAILAERS